MAVIALADWIQAKKANYKRAREGMPVEIDQRSV